MQKCYMMLFDGATNGFKTEQYLLKHEPALVDTFHVLPSYCIIASLPAQKGSNKLCRDFGHPSQQWQHVTFFYFFPSPNWLSNIDHFGGSEATAIRTLRCWIAWKRRQIKSLIPLLASCALNFFHAFELLASRRGSTYIYIHIYNK